MRSPATALEFMASLVDGASSVSSAVGDVGLFGTYVARSWGGILRSSGIL
jgi:ubiquinone biosynthesis protein COQ9